METNYIDELNPGQKEAVLYNDGPSLVIAGAGSGKTRVLTYKVAWLLEQGFKPWNILALTFTNKAAREMKERIARQVGAESARRLWMGTFHSLFLRILHAEAPLLGFTSQFTIYDTSDSKSLIRSILKEMGLDEKIYKPGVVQARISNAKNRLVTPQAYAASGQLYADDCAAKMPALRDVYRRYVERCRTSDAMDFDDLLLYTYLLFREHEEVRQRYSHQFGYILVDEYQDTNYAQHCIVQQLAEAHQRVCVVGDDAQSIYSFRGADIDNILTFTKVYPAARIFKLEQNYRSTQTIVQAANSLIAKNRGQIPKQVFSEKETGERIGVFRAYSDVEEGEIVVNKLQSFRRTEGDGYADFAILYRTNAQSRIFEEALRKRAIPYYIYGGLSFYQRKEIKDVIAYMRLVVNPNDEEAFKRVINYPARGIGDTTVGKIISAASEHGVSLWQVLCMPLEYGLNFNKGTATRLQGFRQLMENLMEMAAESNAYEVGVEVVKRSGIMADVCADNLADNLSRKENIEELLNGVSDFCDQRLEEGNEHVRLGDFLSEVSLLTDQDQPHEENDERVTLMTIHAAKGLEFRNVFVVGMEENLFPSPMTDQSPRALEEERRLFYVAITRAQQHCYLSYARSRFRYGKMEFGTPSRFLRDIDARYLQLPRDLEPASRPIEPVQPRRVHIAPPAAPRTLRRVESVPAASQRNAGTPSLQPGQHIQHERFGHGQVLQIEGSGENVKATIRFDNAGVKQLLLRFARFKVVE